MKKLLIFIMLSAGYVWGQVSVPPQSTPSPQKANLTWTIPTTGLPSGTVACSTTQQCIFKVYRFSGTATSSDLSSPTWTLATTTSAQASAYTDNPGAGTWSYVIEAVFVSNGNNSGPSNIVVLTLTNPPVPAPPSATGSAGL